MRYYDDVFTVQLISIIYRYSLMTHHASKTVARTVAFICTGNSCRSQMAEGWTRSLHGERVHVYSAGTIATALDPTAVEVMAEVGIDISHQHSKVIEDLPLEDIQLVITVCDNARDSCPILPASITTIHHSFDDPPSLAHGLTGESRLNIYRRIRDEIQRFVEQLVV